MTVYSAKAFTMQALVKYHGLRSEPLRLPYHDSISANTSCMMTEARLDDEEEGGVYTDGILNASANQRLKAVVSRLDKDGSVTSFRIDSRNSPAPDAKGIGYSSSAGAALTLLCHRRFVGGEPDLKSLSRISRLFAASAARSLVGGFSRLYAGTDKESYAERFAESTDLDLRMVVVPLSSKVRTEDAHREVLSSPFFDARVRSAQKRCDEMEKAIKGNDLDMVGRLAERDTLELHALTMTGDSRMIIFSEDSLRVIWKVRQLRDDGVKAYFSMQTGPSVFINTSPEHQSRVLAAVRKMGYRAFPSKVGGAAFLVTDGTKGKKSG